MTSDLAQLLDELRADLAADEPASLAYAQIGAPADDGDVPAELPAGLRDLLLVADGLRAGAFELASTDRLTGVQYFLDYAPAFSPIPQDKTGWLVIGTRSDEPIFLERETGAVWYFPPTGTEWFMGDAFEELAPDLDSFVHYYVLGPGYAELVTDDDAWYAFLDRQGLLDDADEVDEDEAQP
ncbi:SUKH-4 family immunity protein [Micromonospora aurantiaca (nom. illeg.)]|uniref:SUKH-4 family immunity protein n=1 Tax=Micromonospora aurantiaca (nom. illeg.) TaxID=47850 RepID=UPI003F49DD6A